MRSRRGSAPKTRREATCRSRAASRAGARRPAFAPTTRSPTAPPSAFYDSMLARVIADAPTRREALARLAVALDSTVCWGVTTNREFLARVVRDDAFGAGAFDTTFLARRFGDDAARSTAAPTWLEAIAAASLALLPRAPLPPLWCGWSSSRSIDTLVPVEIDGAVRRWHLTGSHEWLDASCAASTHRIAGLSTTAR